MDTKSSGPGPLVWIFAFVAIAALAFFGWRSNQRPAAIATPQAPAAAPAKQAQPKLEAPIVTETNGGLPG